MTWSRRFALAALLVALLAGVCAAAVGEQADAVSPYEENEWGFVDASMDTSGGIPGDAMGALATIREKGVLRVATEPYFPPQEFIDPNLEGQDRYVGADMEMARLIAKRMGVALEIVPMEFSEVLQSVIDGSCDLAISGLSYTPGRAAAATLSKGYNFAGENAGTGLLIRAADSEAITGVDSLTGRDIAAQSGSLQEALMAEHVFRYHEFRRIPLMQDIYQALIDGAIDAAAVDLQSARVYIQNNPEDGLAIVPGVRFVQEAQYDGDRVAARKDEGQLIAFVNGVIDELLASGQYEAWFEEYTARADELGL